MMSFLRLLWFPLLLALTAMLIVRVPGHSEGNFRDGFHIVEALRSVVDPLVLSLAIGSAVVLVLPWIALFPTARPSRLFAALRNPAKEGSEVLNRLLAQAFLVAGTLVAILVELAGIQSIAASGGNADPTELQDLSGRMLVPVAAGPAITVGLRGLAGRARVTSYSP
jgi:hypothetical protein